jgi:predicted metal-dependent phosphoesterase TrpH
MSRCDLHMHSSLSDGRFDPGEVASRAALGGLDIVALTDHDVPGALPPGDQIHAGRAITVIAAVEVSTALAGAEQHLLVYFGGEIPAQFRDFCRDQCIARADRWSTACAALALDLPPGDDAREGRRALTRYHLAQALVAAGRCATIQEAFARHIGDEQGVVPCVFPTMDVAIARARAAGGLPVWAHPTRAALERHAAALAVAGLAGIEGLRPGSNSADRQLCRKIARKHGLVVTGGSDWHGWSDQVRLGLFSVDHREIAPFFAALA